MLRDIYGKDYERNPRAKKVQQKLQELDMTRIDFPVFKDFIQKHPAMLHPAFTLQHHLKKRIMGAAFWKRQAATRAKIGGRKYVSIEDIAGDLLSKWVFTESVQFTHRKHYFHHIMSCPCLLISSLPYM